MKTSNGMHLAGRRLPRGAHAERGSALLLALIMGVVLASILAGMFAYISFSSKIERRSNMRIESTYAAEVAMEQAFQQLQTLLSQSTANLPDIAATTGATNLTKAPTSTFGAADGYTWKTYLTVPVENGVVTGAQSSFNPTQGVYKFMTIVEFTRTVANMNNPVHVQLQREWVYSLTPLFQYAIFYDGNMELFPGATFNVTGRVHTNGTLYTGTNATLIYNDLVTDVNGNSNTYMPGDPRAPATLTGTTTFNSGTPLSTNSLTPPGKLSANTSDANHNNDGPHELIELPNSWQTDPDSSDRMYNKAGLKILVNSTSTAVTADSGVTIPANSKVFMAADGTVIPSTDPLATYLSTLVSNGSIQDYRENATVTTTDVDVSKLNTAYTSGGLPQTLPSGGTWPNGGVPAALKGQSIAAAVQGKSFWNGIIYVADVTNSSSHRTGVKLINGGSLPNGGNSSSPAAGLTVATLNPAYIVGDYNTGGTPPVDSGTTLTANNYAPGYTVQPAAVIADAVTVLSGAWSSSNNASTALSSRTAQNTTINSALISGTVPTDSTSYSGGVENYIRLGENWSGKRLTYYGSMINLYNSQQSTGRWSGTGTYYQAANRNWYFDVNFLNPNKLPPGTPILRTLYRGQWTQIATQ